jgi:hypothetical protein
MQALHSVSAGYFCLTVLLLGCASEPALVEWVRAASGPVGRVLIGEVGAHPPGTDGTPACSRTLAVADEALTFPNGWELRPAGSLDAASAAGSATLPLASGDPSGRVAGGGSAGSGGDDGSDVPHGILAAAGLGHWQEPPVVVALGMEQGGSAGAMPQTEPLADLPTPPGVCACRAAGLHDRPVQAWWPSCMAGVALVGRWLRRRHAPVARRTNIG